MMSNPVRKIYNFTCDGHNFISKGPPSTLPKSYYSLVEVAYSQSMIVSIKGIYIGEDRNEKSEVIFNDIDIDELKPDGYSDTFLQLLWEYVDKMELSERTGIIDNLEIIDLSGSIPLKLEQIFMIQLASTLIYFHFMVQDQKNIGYPFYPVRINFPGEISLTSIDKNVIDYLSYPARILFNIGVKAHGKLWMVQIMNFANTWGDIIPRRYIVNNDKTEAIYESVLGYSDYLYLETSSIYNHFKNAETVINTGMEYINSLTSQNLEIIDSKSEEVNKRLKYASILITTITTLALKTLKIDTDVSEQEIIECKNKCIIDLEGIFQDITKTKQQTIKHLNGVADDIDHTLHDLASKYMEDIDSKTKNVDKEIEELQRQLKIYSTRNIQELQLTKRDVIKFMYDQVPGILEQVRGDVDDIIDKNVTNRIDDKFSDVLNKFHDQAEYKVRDSLEPVISTHIKKLKKEYTRVIDSVNDDVDKAKHYANISEGISKKVEAMANQTKNIASGSAINREIQSLKTEIIELKKQIKEISKAAGIQV